MSKWKKITKTRNLLRRKKLQKSYSNREKNYRFFIGIKQTITGFSTVNKKIKKQ